jgi:hypothetical protein
MELTTLIVSLLFPYPKHGLSNVHAINQEVAAEAAQLH